MSCNQGMNEGEQETSNHEKKESERARGIIEVNHGQLTTGLGLAMSFPSFPPA